MRILLALSLLLPAVSSAATQKKKDIFKPNLTSLILGVRKDEAHLKFANQMLKEIKNAEDRKTVSGFLKRFKAPKDMSIESNQGRLVIRRNGKLALNLKWLSYKPQVLAVNGQILINDSKSLSWTGKFNEIWKMRKNKKQKNVAWLNVIPEANAEEDWEFEANDYQQIALTYAIYDTRILGTATEAINDDTGSDTLKALPEGGSFQCTPKGFVEPISYDMSGEAGGRKFQLVQVSPLKFHVVDANGERWLLDLKARTTVFDKGSKAHLCGYAEQQPISAECNDVWQKFLASNPDAQKIWEEDGGVSTINCRMFDTGSSKACEQFMQKAFPDSRKSYQLNLADSDADPDGLALKKCKNVACTELDEDGAITDPGQYWDYINKANGLVLMGDCCTSDSCRSAIQQRKGITLTPDSQSGSGGGVK